MHDDPQHQGSPERFPDAIAAEAAAWMARRDRGLTAAEQDAYLQWLGVDEQHGRAVALVENCWTKLDQLSDWRPAHSRKPNPDLLAPRRRGGFRLLVALLAAAAVVTLAILLSHQRGTSASEPQLAILHPGPERLVLEDGSVVELKKDSHVEVQFTSEFRRVHLQRGEAYFSVAKNPERPFIVTANRVDVQAVGTAFSVLLEQTAVSVLVTEGDVRLDELPEALETTERRHLSDVTAGQHAVVEFADPLDASNGGGEGSVRVRDITPAEVDRVLAWQGMRLEFIELPLRDVVREFNRFNVRKLSVADEVTGALRVGGQFRADNVEAFVRLMEQELGISAVPDDSGMTLRYMPLASRQRL